MKTVCPHCNTQMNHHINPDYDNEIVPMDGDLGICSACKSISIFDNSQLRKATKEEIQSIKSDPELCAELKESIEVTIPLIDSIINPHD